MVPATAIKKGNTSHTTSMPPTQLFSPQRIMEWNIQVKQTTKQVPRTDLTVAHVSDPATHENKSVQHQVLTTQFQLTTFIFS
jgi:hypothetical protein